jgi:Phage tail tube protein
MNFNRQALGVKIQASIGTPATIAFATDAVRIASANPQPYVADDVPIPEINASLDAPRTLPYNERSTLELTINAFASGAAGTAPKWNTLMRMASFAETITAATRAEYSPINSAFERATVDHHVDAVRMRTTDAIADFRWTWDAGGPPQFVFPIQGTTQAIADVAFPSPVLTGWLDPKVVSKANTTGTIGGYAACISQFSGQLGNQLTSFDRINCSLTELTRRAKTGSIAFEMTTVAAKDWYTLIKNQTPQAIVITHGSGAGNVLKMTISDAILKPLSISDDNGIVMATCAYDFRSLVISSE